MIQFGRAHKDVEYQVRPGAYALIFDSQGRIASVESKGRLYLPGGGALADETPETTLVREIREETGWKVSVGCNVGEAAEYVYEASTGTGFNKLGSFHLATIIDFRSSAAKPEHSVHWVSRDEFISRAAHESHVWAARTALASPR